MRSASAVRTVGCILAGTLLLSGAPGHATRAQAQERSPLAKSEIVRLLTGGTYSSSEVATIIRQNCLSFTPTSRDLTDFRALGADPAIVDEIEQCVAEARPGATPETGPAIELAQRTWDATAGAQVSIQARLRAGATPLPGERLGLTGVTEIEGGTGFDPVTETAADGLATFTINAGTLATTYPLTVRVLDRSGVASQAITLRVGPGSPAVVDAAEEVLDPSAGPIGLQLVVRDAWGNAVPGAPLALIAGDADGDVLFEGAAASDGSVTVRLPEEALAGVPRVTVLSGGTRLGALAVAEGRRPASIAIVSGGSQVGEPGQTLADPLVVEVRDAEGEPVPGAVVSIEASAGAVNPRRAAADSDGRVEAIVSLGGAGSETVVRVSAGGAVREVRYAALRGGRSIAEIEADLDQADLLLASGEIAAARALYEEVSRSDPLNRRATLGRSRAALAAAQPLEAASLAETLLRRNPEDVEAWMVLGDARLAVGDTDAARFAYEQVLLLDPGNDAAESALAVLDGVTPQSRPVFALEAWGGTTVDDGRGFGLPYAEARVVPAGWLELRATYDDMLGLRHPYLVRGRDALQGIFGAASLRYGAGDRWETTFEMGRREQPEADDLTQTSWRLEQAIPLSVSSVLRLGGWLGRWYDRDDMALYADARFALGSGLSLRPMVSWADNAGSNVTGDDGEPGTGRAPETEIRAGLGLRIEDGAGWGLEPAIAYGSVSSDRDDAFDGGLLDLTTRAWARVGSVVSLNGFVRYQSPPGTPSFVTIALGLGIAIR